MALFSGGSPTTSKKPYPSIRLFESDFMEWGSHVHPITPLVMWVPVISYLIYRSVWVLNLNPWGIAGIGVAGLFIWTLSEYLLHRFVFHFPAESKFGKRMMYIIHGLHHADPMDPTRLVMPPVPGIVLAVTLYAIFGLLIGFVWVQPFFAFFLIGYLCYDYTHYAVHHFTPKTKFGKLVKQHHMMHHFVSQDARWGVSTPVWDYVFGTMAARETADKSRPA